MTKRVLLAEDEPNIVESLTFILERSGFDVSVTTTGREALEQAQSAIPRSSPFFVESLNQPWSAQYVPHEFRTSQYSWPSASTPQPAT